MREDLQWFEDRPLFGVRIAIPRPIPQAYETADLAFAYGAVPLLLPTIAIEPPADWAEVDRAIADIERNDWLIFTSRNGVTSFFDRFFELGHDARRLSDTKIAVIGSATSAALREYHLHADLVPETFRAEALAEELSGHVRDKNVLWCGADRGREVLPDELSPVAAEFRKLVVYRNLDVESWPDDVCSQLKAGYVDWLALSSPSIAEGAARLLPAESREMIGKSLRVAAISPVTAEAAQNAGLRVDVVAETYTWPGILDAIAGTV
jgi:uroporphyrinogen III methyltransferase/synthase